MLNGWSSRSSPDPEDIASLSSMEAEVLIAFGNGRSREEIARALRISVRTVGHALTIAKEKLGARTLAEAAVTLALMTHPQPHLRRTGVREGMPLPLRLPR
jgi:DNA-binding CsgD family transcriptional regulator